MRNEQHRSVVSAAHARLWVAVLAVLVAPGATLAAAQRPAAGPPNILWITVEDLSPRIGAYGDPLAQTPHVDRLAREGVRFTRAFVTQPICAPSRSAIITGMYQTSIGTHHMRTTEDTPDLPGPYLAVPPHYVKAFTEYLRAAGYYTTNNVKTDYQFAPLQDPRQPLTAWDESSNRAHWRNRPDPEQPFFSVFNIMTPHESFVWADHPIHEGAGPITDPAAVELPPYYPDTPLVRADLARHYDNIARMDTRVGEILHELEADGLAQNTIVFFWTDHGDGLPRMKRWLYDSGLHVPLIVRWPGTVRPGTVNEELVSFVDLGPTVLAMAGVEIPGHLQGRVLLGPHKGSEPRYIFATRDRVDTAYDMVRAVRDRRFKYIRNFHPELPYVLHVPYRNQGAIMQELLRLHAEGGLTEVQALWLRDNRPPEELYDTRADPHEVRNLAGEPRYRQVLQQMRGGLAGWMEESGDWGRVPEAEMIQRMWPGGVQPQTASPVILPRRDTARQLAPTDAYTLNRAGEVIIYVPTQGASIAYTVERGEDARWLLYTGPIRVTSTTTIRARAIRYGYQESEEVTTTFNVEVR
jgi:N-sulfoglucosamine sulfohydrolase